MNTITIVLLTSIASFFIGLFIGANLGVVTMCVLRISGRGSRREESMELDQIFSAKVE